MLGDVWISPAMMPMLTESLGVEQTTIEGWVDDGWLPLFIHAVLDLTQNGNLGRIHEDWNGWKIDTKTGDLVTPVVKRGRNRKTNPGEIMVGQLRYQLISALKTENRELRDRCQQLENRIKTLEKYLEAYENGSLVALPHRGKL